MWLNIATAIAVTTVLLFIAGVVFGFIEFEDD